MQQNGVSQLEIILSARLELTQKERALEKDALSALESKIKAIFDRIGKKPKETFEELDLEWKNLERLHITTTQVNGADERNFMRSLDKIKTKKKQLTEYLQSQEELNTLRENKKEALQELREKEKSISEIMDGLKRVRLASRIGCTTSDIIEQSLEIPENCLAKIIGKGGSKLKQLESSHDISIDVDKNSTELHLMGTTDSIAAGIEAIMEVVNTVTEEFQPKEETIVCLMLNKAALLYELQDRHKVRLDVSKAKRLCKVTGYAEAVAQARLEIEGIDCRRFEIPLESSMLPFIIGKGGSTIRAMTESNRVSIDLSKEENRVVVSGFRAEVFSAVSALTKLIEENKEVEQTIQVNRSIITNCLIGPGGSIAKALQKELGVYLRIDHNAEAAKDSTHAHSGSLESVTIIGANLRVATALEHISKLLAAHTAESDTVEVPAYCVPIIVGKKGIRIITLREDFPNVKIDIDGNLIHLLSPDMIARSSVRAAIAQIVAENYQETLVFPSEHCIALKGPRGAATRQKLTSDMGISMDISSEEDKILLRGAMESVQLGIELLNEFRRNNYSEVWRCKDDECAALMTMAPGATVTPAREFEAEFGVAVMVHRISKELRNDKKKGEANNGKAKSVPQDDDESGPKEDDFSHVRIRGNEVIVPQAMAAVKAYLSGDERRGTAVLVTDPASISALIGKGGVTIKQMEKDHAIKIDINDSREKIRIRCQPNHLKNGVLAVLSFLNEVKMSTTLDLSTLELPNFSSADVEEAMKQTRKVFGVDLSSNNAGNNSEKVALTRSSILTLRGSVNYVEDAKKYLIEQITGTTKFVVTLDPEQLEGFSESNHSNFSRISSKHNVMVSVNAANCSIEIEGATSQVMKARIDVMKVLDHLFPSQFLSVAMPSKCLQDIGNYRHLVEIQESTEARLRVDYALSCIHVRGHVASVAVAVSKLKQDVAQWKDTHSSIEIEEFLIALVIGKNGSTIEALQKETNTKIQFNRDGNKLEISGTEKDEVDAAVATIVAKIVHWKGQHWETTIDKDLVGIFIGKEGSNIKKMKADTTVTIDVDSKTGQLKVHGPPAEVAVVKDRILHFVKEEKLNSFVMELSVPSAGFPVLIGSKGVVIRELQQTSDCRIELDKAREIVSVKGRKENCEKACTMIEEVLIKGGFAIHVASNDVPAKVSGEEIESDLPQPATAIYKHKYPPGATPEMIARINEKSMSKSALRRAKRKAQQNKTQDQDSDGETDEYDDETPISTTRSDTQTPISVASPHASGSANMSIKTNGLRKVETSGPLTPSSLMRSVAARSELTSNLLTGLSMSTATTSSTQSSSFSPANHHLLPPVIPVPLAELSTSPQVSSYTGQTVVVPANNSSNVASTEYYKSKSGFSIRL